MSSRTSALSVMLLMAVTLCTVCVSAFPVVKVEYNITAVLPCTEKCSGVIRWTLFHNRSDILAECDQTECRSVKVGYQMIYNQYLQGDLSLIITEANFMKRGLYTCECDGTDLCGVVLQIETLKTTVQKRPGESLVLDLHVSDKVEVRYYNTDPAEPSNHLVYKVKRPSVQLSPEYSERASVSPDLELRGMKESDSGVYTVRDTSTEELIHIYTVIVHGDSEAGGHEQKPSDPTSSTSPGQGAALPGWLFGVLVGLGVVCVVSLVVIVVQRRKNQRLQRESASKRNPQNNSTPLTETDKKRSPDEGKNLLQQTSSTQNPA